MREINLMQLKGKIFQHFKGNLYLLLDVVEHSETGEELVIYKALYGTCKTYARPKKLFLEEVDLKKYPDVLQEYRFEPKIIKDITL